MLSSMTTPSTRLTTRVRRDFAEEDAGYVLTRLEALPDLAYGRQDHERMQSALVLAAGGDRARFEAGLRLLDLDWRDVLVGGGLGHGDWPRQLEKELGPDENQEPDEKPGPEGHQEADGTGETRSSSGEADR